MYYAKRTLQKSLVSLRHSETLIEVELCRYKEMIQVSAGIENDSLGQNDLAFLRKAKRDFDHQIATISDTLLNFKYSFFELYRYKKLFKRMRNTVVEAFPPMFPVLYEATLWIEDLEMLR